MPLFDGNVIKLPDKVDTDIIIPTQYMTLKTVEEMAPYAFSPLRDDIPKIAKKGDFLVCGTDFGCGSSREQALEIIKVLGIRAVIAKSFARIFYRNAINNGLLVIESLQLHDRVEEGDTISIDTSSNLIGLPDKKTIPFGKIPARLSEIIECGGLLNFYRRINNA